MDDLDEKAKSSGRKSGSAPSRPGAQAVGKEETQLLDERIAAKREGRTVPGRSIEPPTLTEETSLYASARKGLDDMPESGAPAVLRRKVSRDGSVGGGLSPYASARDQLSQIKDPSQPNFPKPGVQQVRGEDKLVATKTQAEQLTQYEKDVESKRKANAYPGATPTLKDDYEERIARKQREHDAEKAPTMTSPAEYAVSIALGETEESDDYEARLAAKNAEFTPPTHSTEPLNKKGKEDDEDLEELLAMKHAQNGGYDASYASNMGASYNHVDDLAKAKAGVDDSHTMKAGYVQDPGMEKAVLTSQEKDVFGYHGGSDDMKDFEPPPEQNPAQVTEAYGRINAPPMEYGEMQAHGGEGFVDENLAVAVAITENEEDAFIPAAIEYDPDSKPPIYKNRRFRFYFAAAAFLLVAIGVSVALGVTSSSNDATPSPTPAPTSLREALGIQDQLISVVGETSIDDSNSPHAKAGEWLINQDPQELAPEADNLIQRYLLAVFYFATTENKPWLSCNKPSDGEPLCNFTKLTQVFPEIEYENITWTRWLSDSHECEWAGVFCDEFNQTRAIELRKFFILGRECVSLVLSTLPSNPPVFQLDKKSPEPSQRNSP